MDVSNLQLQPQVLGGVTQPVSPAIIGIVDNILNMQFNPFQSVIVVKRSEYDMLQEGGRAWLAEHLRYATLVCALTRSSQLTQPVTSHTLEKDVIWVEDGTSAMERYFVGPIEEFICENRMLINIDGGAVLVERPTSKGILDKIRGEEKSKRKPQRISRPPNAYILYRKDHHQMIKAAHPSYTNNDICM